MEEGIIPTAPRKAFCPPDNCPSSQQCPRCRTNNRGLPRPVLPPATPWISTSPKAPRLQYQPRLYPLNPPPIITANPIKSVPARVRGNTHSVRCKQHPHRSPASWRKQLCHDFVSSSCCIHRQVTQLCFSRYASSEQRNIVQLCTTTWWPLADHLVTT